MKYDIFLSYASEDVSRASELVRILEKEGWSVWWDRHINPGQDFEVEIDQAISNSRAVMVLWSVFSVSSTWVRNEANEAKDSKKLIPIKLDDVKVPLSFRSLNTIELIGWPESKSVLGVSMLKSSLNRFLKTGPSSESLEKPSTEDEMTLSVRVASRVADLVKANAPINQVRNDIERQFEKCVTEICLNIVFMDNTERRSYLSTAVDDLASSLNADYAITGRFKPDTAIVEILGGIDGDPIPEAVSAKVAKKVESQLQQYGTEINTAISMPNSDFSDMLFFYEALPENGSGFSCFVANTPKWPAELQRNLTRLSSAFSDQ